MSKETKAEEKLALFLSKKDSLWKSCQIIVPNILELYRRSFDHAKIKVFNYQEGMGAFEYFSNMKELVAFSPDRIIICDHKPHPEKLIKGFLRYWNIKDIPPIYIHIFGDFSLYSASWAKLESLLQQLDVKFIAASHRQVNFVKQFIEDADSYVDYLPFPVNEAKFAFSAQDRKSSRKELGWEGKPGKNFLYTGRISLQKNVVSLIQLFRKFLEISGSSSYLNIAGFFDNLAYPFFGIYYPPELNRYYFFEILDKIGESSLKDRVRFLGNLEYDDLYNYYHACDVFVSLSVHNDEDYGMSPAEALCCGMPLILSDWGGHSSFSIPGVQTSHVGVREVDTFYQPDFVRFTKLLIEHDNRNVDDEQREEISSHGLKNFSIEGCRKSLLALHRKPVRKFSKWNQKFKDFSWFFKNQMANPFGIKIQREDNDIDSNNGVDINKMRTRKIYRDCYNEYINRI